MKPRRIVHLGLGNFARAHLAAYTQNATATRQDWRITGVSLRSPEMSRKLGPQNGNYTLVVRGPEGSSFQRITCLDDVFFAPEERQAVFDAICDPQTQIVTLTITEKGYHLAPDGALDLEAREIRKDLEHPPETAIGLLTHALALRKTPLTVISCDNLLENGRKLETAISDFGAAAGLSFQTSLSFPNTMVDRITPATTSALCDEVAAQTGWADAAPVETEAFSEWVIEDGFVSDRPDWYLAGAKIVEDVAPFEARKLRMLNGAHSMLAYAGLNAGFDYVHEAIADPRLRQTAQDLMAEAADTLPDGLEPGIYADALLSRFSNPALQHALKQIAMDGSLKLPVRILPTIRALKDAPACRQAIAEWMVFAKAQSDAGLMLDDPQAEKIRDACAASQPAKALLRLVGEEDLTIDPWE